jgi:hypothetical protein
VAAHRGAIEQAKRIRRKGHGAVYRGAARRATVRHR